MATEDLTKQEAPRARGRRTTQRLYLNGHDKPPTDTVHTFEAKTGHAAMLISKYRHHSRYTLTISNQDNHVLDLKDGQGIHRKSAALHQNLRDAKKTAEQTLHRVATQEAAKQITKASKALEILQPS